MEGLSRFFLLIAMGCVCYAAAAQTQQTTAPVADVAAFARLYGVVRYYYPGDAVQEINWNRFAVNGVSQVRGAHDARDLATRLQKLFDPITTGIVILPEKQAFPTAKPLPNDQLQVYWQRQGSAD